MSQASAVSVDIDAADLRQHWTGWIAYWISQVVSPPVLVVVVTGLSARYLATRAGWFWAMIYLLLAVVFPCIYVGWLVARGRLADPHLPLREQRIRPLLCTALMGGAAWLVLYIASAPPLLQWIACANALQVILFLLITLRWKISLHSAAAANLAVVGILLLGVAGLPLISLVLVVSWARVYLQRHTIAETTAGVLLGAVALVASYWLFQPT
jgi:membrane-associated phospholipid phosphatase